mmetsp:Transcript_9756/g.13435  ORF Transcript_9756/g.13435 Transcript_9756/m.13435 type:complete len:283 (-) Transcript_9756:263-1111(-)
MTEEACIAMVSVEDIVRRTVDAIVDPKQAPAMTTVPASQATNVRKYLEQLSKIIGIRLSYERVNDDIPTPRRTHAIGTILRRGQSNSSNDRKSNCSVLKGAGSKGKKQQQSCDNSHNGDLNPVASSSTPCSESFIQWAVQNRLAIENNIRTGSTASFSGHRAGGEGGGGQLGQGGREGGKERKTHTYRKSLLQQIMRSPVTVEEEWVWKTARSVSASRKSVKRKVEKYQTTKGPHKMKRMSGASLDSPLKIPACPGTAPSQIVPVESKTQSQPRLYVPSRTT